MSFREIYFCFFERNTFTNLKRETENYFGRNNGCLSLLGPAAAYSVDLIGMVKRIDQAL